MNYKPNVSIGLPVHNGERYLDETIELALHDRQAGAGVATMAR